MIKIKQLIYAILLCVPCHRKKERCIYINGEPMPICIRCLSMIIGYLFIPIMFLFHIGLIYSVLLQLPMLIDGYTQLRKWRTSNNFLRFITGIISGFGLSVFIVAAVRFLTNSVI